MREIILGLDSSERTTENLEWAARHVSRMRKEVCNEILAFDVENVLFDVYAVETLKIRQREMRAGKKVLPVRTYRKRLRSPGVNIPARLLCGDGTNFLLTFKFPWQQVYNDDGEEAIFHKGLPAVLLHIINFTAENPCFQFLCQFSGFSGANITQDLLELQQFLADTYHISAKLPRGLELSALYLAAGGCFNKTSLAHLNYLVTGGVMNKLVSTMDNRWYLDLDKLGFAAVSYMVDDVRSAYVSSTVLMSMLIRSLFPDPDCTCFTFNLTQEQWVNYCSNVITYSLSGLKIQHPELMNPSLNLTRSQLLLNLRPEGVADYDIEGKLNLFSLLLPISPTLPHGGGRILHQARSFFLDVQYYIIKQLDTPSSVAVLFVLDDLPNDLLQINHSYLLFGRSLDNSQKLVLPPLSDPGLFPTPLFLPQVNRLKTMILASADSLHPAVLGVEAARAGISMSEVLLECACVFPYIIPIIIAWLDKSDLESHSFRWWRQRPSLYERLRFMYSNITNEEAAVATNMNSLLDQKDALALQNEVEARGNNLRDIRMMVALKQTLSTQGSKNKRPLNLHRMLYSFVPGQRTHLNYMRKQEKKRRKAGAVHQRLGQAGVHYRLGGPVNLDGAVNNRGS